MALDVVILPVLASLATALFISELVRFFRTAPASRSSRKSVRQRQWTRLGLFGVVTLAVDAYLIFQLVPALRI